MKILLTGSDGQLGRDFQAVGGLKHEIVAHDIDLDITDADTVKSAVSSIRPDLVVNAAAYTDVDGAEDNEIAAYRVNALGVQNLALACQAGGTTLLHVSTDFVFSGEANEPYTEFDRPEPVGIYGKSKYAGELYVTSLLDRYYICRTSWLFGVAGSNFVKKMLELGNTLEEVRVVDDQYGRPTYSRDLASKLLEVIDSGAFGVFHLSNRGSCTWFELARAVFDIAGIETPLVPVTTEQFGAPAPRPRYSVMRGLALELAGIEPMRHYLEALEDFILRDLEEWEATGERR